MTYLQELEKSVSEDPENWERLVLDGDLCLYRAQPKVTIATQDLQTFVVETYMWAKGKLKEHQLADYPSLLQVFTEMRAKQV